MFTRPTPALSCACVVVIVLVTSSASHALTIDDFTDGSLPTFDGSRIFGPPPTNSGFTVSPGDLTGLLEWETDDVTGTPSAELNGVINFAATTSIDASKQSLVRVGIYRAFLDGEFGDELDPEATMTVILGEGSNSATYEVVLPLKESIPVDLLHFDLPIKDFVDIGSVDTSALTNVVLALEAENNGIVIVTFDSVELVPTPAALPAGLVAMALIAARRRRR